MANYIQPGDVQARMSVADYNRAFDRDGDGNATKIAANVLQAIAAAQSYVNMTLGASFGPLVALDANGGVVDEWVKSHMVALTIWEAIRYSPLATGVPTSPYRQAYEDARKFFDALRDDNGARLQTSQAGRARPRANVGNVLQADGVTYNQQFNRAADGKDPSGF